MFVKINNKPIKVKADNERIDWTYMVVSCSGIGLATLLIDKVCMAFLGVSFFVGYMNDFMRMIQWLF